MIGWSVCTRGRRYRQRSSRIRAADSRRPCGRRSARLSFKLAQIDLAGIKVEPPSNREPESRAQGAACAPLGGCACCGAHLAMAALPAFGCSHREAGLTRSAPRRCDRATGQTQPSVSTAGIGYRDAEWSKGAGAAVGRKGARRSRSRRGWRRPAALRRPTFLIPPRIRSLTVEEAQRAQPASSRKNARITRVPWNLDSVGVRPIYRRPWCARCHDCFLLTHIISMSLSAYSVGSTRVGSAHDLSCGHAAVPG
jgi:hypothetical protein